jgi:hypothetical protein
METLTFQERLVKVQGELKAPKGQFNNFGKYAYRSCEDILESVKPLLTKYGLALKLSDSVEELGGVLFANARATVWDSDGTSAEVTAQAGIDVSKKGMDLSQTFGSASSYARKYALNGLFLIDDTKDADATNTHGRDQKPASTSLKQLPSKGEVFNKAKAHIERGGSIDDIRKKYQVSKEVEKLLNN